MIKRIFTDNADDRMHVLVYHRAPGLSAADQHLRDLAWLRRVRDRIDRDYAQPLDVEALARGAHMSAGHFSREFRRAYGESPYAYLMTRRIERAMALLRRGDLSVTEVCFAVGCSSLGTFSTRFTELVGVPPSTYRREAKQATLAGLAEVPLPLPFKPARGSREAMERVREQARVQLKGREIGAPYHELSRRPSRRKAMTVCGWVALSRSQLSW